MLHGTGTNFYEFLCTNRRSVRICEFVFSAKYESVLIYQLRISVRIADLDEFANLCFLLNTNLY
jgi:hypothetical protein